ncbi:PREDICTED: 14 kDa zinc-binding protein isoform X3 [Theobroma cacao]|uniref:14 kDa zinc-binding protein isoform X3 n=1 Tax=Theobroma cacao TaxID=3641 RepID=A0AB32VGN2_THECC|nr:PREDICTED: 14 kDa zinc-binding protein isoform X3 [Theobroma cacao]
MISAQKSMAAFTSFSVLRDYARAGRIVARVRASPGISSYPSSINFLTANHSRRFDKIIAKEIPSTIVYEDDKVLAFKDINPQAPVHVLVIPKFRDGLTQLGKAEPRHGEILGQLLYAAKIVAEKEGIVDGFRVVINNGPSACQSVYHLHLHVLGGRQMNWPPG